MGAGATGQSQATFGSFLLLLFSRIAANPPQFLVIIGKSILECEFPYDEFCFRIIKIDFFVFCFFLFFGFCCPLPSSVDNTVRPPAAINIRARSLILWYSACAAGYNSLFVPVHVRHVLQLQVARPSPKPSPIRNYKLQVGSYVQSRPDMTSAVD